MPQDDPLDSLAAWVRAMCHERGTFEYELERTPRWRFRRRSSLRTRIERRELQESRILERFFNGSLPEEIGVGLVLGVPSPGRETASTTERDAR